MSKVISRVAGAGILLLSAAAWSREVASPSACQAAAAQPAIAGAKSGVERDPRRLTSIFRLADAWSDAGCFNEAVQVLQNAAASHPESLELRTRLRVARSLVGEERFFDNLDRADAEAKLKRDTFRCSTLSDVDACSEAARLKPDDSAALIAAGDALVRANRPGDALPLYRRAAAHSPNPHDVIVKINGAESQLALPQPKGSAGNSPLHPSPPPPAALASATVRPAPKLRVASNAKQYSNAAPETQSH